MSNHSFWERFRIRLSQLIYPKIWKEYYRKCDELHADDGGG